MSKKVVIIGGGVGGVEAAKKLDKFCDVTLIEKNTKFYYPISSPRTLTDANFISKQFVPFNKVLSRGTVLHEEVSEVTHVEVKFKNEKPAITFDYLIIATVKLNFDEDEQKKRLLELNQAVSNATHVLIIGGGTVGVEAAGEIAHKYPDKKITIVHSGNQLISDTAQKKFVDKLVQNFKDMKVNVLLNKKVQLSDEDKKVDRDIKIEPKTYTLSDGSTIDADLLLVCTGSHVNNGLVKTHFADKLEDNGKLRVNKFLQVDGFQNIFAIGDIANTEPGGLSWVATKHGENVASNLKLLMEGKPEKMKSLNPTYIMIVTQGPEKGAGVVGNNVIGNFLTKNLKGKSLFWTKPWEILNQKPPK